MMENKEMPPLYGTRLTREMFNQLVPFGKDCSPQIQSSSGTPPLQDYRGFADILTQHYMPPECFIKLFIQSLVLHAYILRDFPEINATITLMKVVQASISSFSLNPFELPASSQAIHLLWETIKVSLTNLCSDLEQNKHRLHNEWSIVDRTRFIAECKVFMQTVEDDLLGLEEFLEKSSQGMLQTQEFMDNCLKYIQQEHQCGIGLVCKFFDPTHTDLRPARVIFKYYNHSKLDMKTYADTQERYIRITFSPRLFLITDFMMLIVKFFHEYLSHLIAGIYSAPNNVPVMEILTSFEKIPTEVDEGWMMHTARTFLNDKGHKLFEEEERQHLPGKLLPLFDEWIQRLTSPYGLRRDESVNEEYVDKAAKGFRIAKDFLEQVLLTSVCQNDEKRAKKLYYRLSFDLITHYPISGFSHLDFINTLESGIRASKAQLISIVQECVNHQEDYIDIDHLWSSIKQDRSLNDCFGS